MSIKFKCHIHEVVVPCNKDTACSKQVVGNGRNKYLWDVDEQ